MPFKEVLLALIEEELNIMDILILDLDLDHNNCILLYPS